MLDVNVALYLTLLKEQSPSWLQSVSKWHNTTYLRHVSVSWLLPCSEKVFKKNKTKKTHEKMILLNFQCCYVLYPLTVHTFYYSIMNHICIIPICSSLVG